jgi:hypothetical protein
MEVKSYSAAEISKYLTPNQRLRGSLPCEREFQKLAPNADMATQVGLDFIFHVGSWRRTATWPPRIKLLIRGDPSVIRRNQARLSNKALERIGRTPIVCL